MLQKGSIVTIRRTSGALVRAVVSRVLTGGQFNVVFRDPKGVAVKTCRATDLVEIHPGRVQGTILVVAK